jgi:hypothetical protein
MMIRPWTVLESSPPRFIYFIKIKRELSRNINIIKNSSLHFYFKVYLKCYVHYITYAKSCKKIQKTKIACDLHNVQFQIVDYFNCNGMIMTLILCNLAFIYYWHSSYDKYPNTSRTLIWKLTIIGEKKESKKKSQLSPITTPRASYTLRCATCTPHNTEVPIVIFETPFDYDQGWCI